MGKTLFLVFVAAITISFLAGCASTTVTPASTPSAGTVPVSLSMTDDPPAGVTVLFFQVSLTNATLTPASTSGSAAPVSLLSNNTPIEIDVTQLQALSAFLSTANVTPGTYNSLSLTFANPELVIFNASDTSIASTCAVGSVCQIAPSVDNSAPVQFTTSPFPVTVSANSPLGLLIDFHLDTVIQSDLSVSLGVANGISIAELPPAPSHPQFGSVTGSVQSVTASKNEFTLLTAWGRTFTIDAASSTYSDFPASACTTAGISCLSDGQIVQVQITGIETGGILQAGQVTWLQAASQQTAEGTIIGLENSSSGTTMKLILHNNPSNATSLPLGGLATVSIASNATFSVDTNGFTLPAGLSFTSASNLLMGQQVEVNIVAGSLSTTNGQGFSGGWGPPRSISFTTSSVELEPSQATGVITGLDNTAESFTMGGNGGPYFFAWPLASPNALSFNVLTTGATTYRGFSVDSFDGLADNDLVSVSGWLFPPAPSGGPPQVAAQSVVRRPYGMF